MTNNQKAVTRLESIDISAFEDNDTVYVDIDGTKLEIAEYEINFQAREYDKAIAEDPNFFG
jgi:hypothetical protein|tara:strand:- start:652 stop:834 length:183 start_codon:yes stop_codon:yes gene_type:complete